MLNKTDLDFEMNKGNREGDELRLSSIELVPTLTTAVTVIVKHMVKENTSSGTWRKVSGHNH